MSLTSRIQGVELIVEENTNGSQGGNTTIPLFFSVCPPSLQSQQLFRLSVTALRDTHYLNATPED